VTLDEQTSLHFPQRHHRLLLRIAAGPGAAAAPSRRFRLRVVSVANPGAANSVQLACLDMFARPPEQQPAAAAPAVAALKTQQPQQEPPQEQLAPLQLQAGPQAEEQPAGPNNPWAQLFAAS
jgi:peptide-N4-(N-acetyl-beta-glucosaminyl)asparagine amidase